MPIHIVNATKILGDRPVLHSFSAEIADRGVTVFFGQSGIGKTTLLHLLLGLLPLDGGSITGLDEKRIAAVFQENRLLPWATALENVALVLPQSSEAQARAILTQLGLGEELHKKPSELSGGMQRRVALARALVIEPHLLILDEPFHGLDEALKRDILYLLKEYSREHAVVLVSHDPDDATFLEARVYALPLKA